MHTIIRPPTLGTNQVAIKTDENWEPGDKFKFEDISLLFEVVGVTRHGAEIVLTLKEPLQNNFPTGMRLRRA